MKMTQRSILISSLSSLVLVSGDSMFFPWPMPSHYTNGSSSVPLASTFEFVLGDVAASSSILQDSVARYDNLIAVGSSGATTSGLKSCTVEVETVSDNEIASLALHVNESYVLNADESTCSIQAPTVWGAMHGMESFTQSLKRVEVAESVRSSEKSKATASDDDQSSSVPTLFNLPLFISDEPRFTHRGMMIDTSRHFLSVSTIKHVIEALSYDKFNVLHWHMVDAQSFPIAPENQEADLLSEGAYTPKLVYSLQDINDITNYAAARGVRLVLEIDVPGHAASWGAGYPNIMADCEVKYSYNINDFALNPTLDDTYSVLGGLIGDLYESLNNPSTSAYYSPVTIHLGGDEVVYGCWKNDSTITSWMTENGVTSYDDLLGYFIDKAQDIASSVGFGSTTQWEEVYNAGLSGMLAADTIYQVWENEDNIKAITSSKFNTVASPNAYWYMDNTASTWTVMYDYDPSVDLTSAELIYLLGGETAVWAEHVDDNNFDATVHMRAEAVAERLWSSSMQGVTAESDPNILARLLEHRCRLLNRGILSMPLQPGYCANMWV